MTEELKTISPLVQNLLRLMAERGLSPKPLSEKAGLNATALRDIIKGKSQNPRHDTLEKIAAALGVTASELLNLPARPTQALMPLQRIQIRGSVQGGVWRSAIEWPDDDWYSITVPPDDIFPGKPRFGLEVRGRSMDLVFPEPTVLIVVRYWDIERAPRSGEKVIVQRRRKDGDIEATVKEYVVDEKGMAWLWPRSSDPAFQEPYPLGPHLGIEIDDSDHAIKALGRKVNATGFGLMTDDMTVSVIGLIISSYRREIIR